MKKHALNQIKEKAIEKLDAKSQKRVQSQIRELKRLLAIEDAKRKDQQATIETDVTNTDISKTQEDIEKTRCDIRNLKKINELMLIKLIEFLEETGKLTLEDFPIFINKVKQIGEQLALIGQEPTTTATTRTKMGEAG